MPHRFKRARAVARSRAPPYSVHSGHPLATCSPHSELATSSEDMDHIRTPCKRPGARNPRPMKRSDVRQTSQKTQMAWKGEIAGRIIPITNPVEDFLEHFVPGEKPASNVGYTAFEMPKNPTKESDMYAPLTTGFTRLVSRFKAANKLVFKNHNHNRIKFPYKLCESENHVTRPDVIASFPGETSIATHPDGWRNISFVVEAKRKESEDPMKSYSDEHERTLVQLAKSARNLLVSQSRLFVFVIGVYGKLARIFRFDHAGAVCSRAFDYTTRDGGRLVYEFLWRFTHPIEKRCRFVGADPTVTHVHSSEHEHLASKLRDAGVVIHSKTESAKAYRYITVGNATTGTKKYLAYELLFINPHLISRATTVWEAIEVDEHGNPRGNPVVIKDAWRQLVRQKENEHYKDIFASGSDAEAEVLGVAQFLYGDDLGAEEQAAMERSEPGGAGVGHLTVTARHTIKPAHAHNERSHSRLVLGSVGTPLSRFKSTRELAEAFRDAIKGHLEAFKRGILHRDVSEGNVMISRDPNVPYKGFLQDFDYGFNWKNFLARLGLANDWDDWDEFVQDECAKLAEKEKKELDARWRKQMEELAARQAKQASEDSNPDPNERSTSDAESALPSHEEGQTSQPHTDSAQSLNTEDDLSEAELDAVEDLVGVQVPVVGAQSDDPPDEEEVKRQCKQRTGTLYFMAIDLLSPGDVVHEVRHDLESFFWLFIWILLRHTMHMLGPHTCGKLFNHDDEVSCQVSKIGFFPMLQLLVYPHNEPLTQLVAEFSAACKTNNRTGFAGPLDPLTHKRVLDIFDRALARESEWPTTMDQAIPYTIPEVDQLPTQRGSRIESDITGSRISSGAPFGLACPDDVVQVEGQRGSGRVGGPRRSVRLANATPDANNAGAASGSRSRKRSREPGETRNEANDASSTEEKKKRTKKNSKRQGDGDGTSGGRKQTKARRGRK